MSTDADNSDIEPAASVVDISLTLDESSDRWIVRDAELRELGGDRTR